MIFRGSLLILGGTVKRHSRMMHANIKQHVTSYPMYWVMQIDRIAIVIGLGVKDCSSKRDQVKPLKENGGEGGIRTLGTD